MLKIKIGTNPGFKPRIPKVILQKIFSNIIASIPNEIENGVKSKSYNTIIVAKHKQRILKTEVSVEWTTKVDLNDSGMDFETD